MHVVIQFTQHKIIFSIHDGIELLSWSPICQLLMHNCSTHLYYVHRLMAWWNICHQNTTRHLKAEELKLLYQSLHWKNAEFENPLLFVDVHLWCIFNIFLKEIFHCAHSNTYFKLSNFSAHPCMLTSERQWKPVNIPEVLFAQNIISILAVGEILNWETQGSFSKQ